MFTRRLRSTILPIQTQRRFILNKVAPQETKCGKDYIIFQAAGASIVAFQLYMYKSRMQSAKKAPETSTRVSNQTLPEDLAVEYTKVRNDLILQNLVYSYESATTTFLSAWIYCLSNPPSYFRAAPVGILLSIAKPLAMAGLFYQAQGSLNYHEKTVEKHIAWLGFHMSLGFALGALATGVSVGSAATTILMSDVFAITAYFFGYSLYPVIIPDTVDQFIPQQEASTTPQKKKVEIPVDFTSMSVMSQVVALTGSFQAMVLLKVTKLGFRATAQRTISQKLKLFSLSLLIPSAISMLLFKVAQESKDLDVLEHNLDTSLKRYFSRDPESHRLRKILLQGETKKDVVTYMTKDKDFDPIMSYMNLVEQVPSRLGQQISSSSDE